MSWTKFSERLPEESCEAVFVQAEGGSVQVWKRDFKGWRWCERANASWHPITYPEVPKEETQEERDEAVLNAIPIAKNGLYRAGWVDALRHERAEVAKLLAALHPCPYPEAEPIITQLRRRVGLDK